MLTHAIRIHENGGVEKMIFEPVELRQISANEVIVKNTAIGVNFIDTYYRSGLYKTQMPAILGNEGAGVIEKVGENVTDFKVGDRVCYCDPIGSYAQMVIRPANRLIKIPKYIDDKTAASALLKGLTATYLCTKTYKVKRGDIVLIYSVSGGVGQILCQIVKSLGATVIGTVGNDNKVETAKKVGCDYVIVPQNKDIVKEIRQISAGVGVDAVFDGNGKDSFMNSLNCLKPHGMMISFGNASGKVAPFDIGLLAQKGSLYLVRPSLTSYTASSEDLSELARSLFGFIKDGVVKIETNHVYALKDASRAHADLEARKTTGSIVLLP